MGTFVESRMNFVTGSAMMEQNRAELYVDDQVRGGNGPGRGEGKSQQSHVRCVCGGRSCSQSDGVLYTFIVFDALCLFHLGQAGGRGGRGCSGQAAT